MKKFLAILSMFALLGGQSSVALGQTRIFRGGAPAITEIQGITAEGSGTLPNPTLIGGDNGTDITNITVDPQGHLQVDVLSGGVIPAVFGPGTEALAQRVTIANDSTGLLSVDDNGGSLTVDGVFFQATQPISAVSLPLPTGATTETTLLSIDTELGLQGTALGSIDTAVSSIDTKTPALGTALIAASTPVNIASDQTVPISVASLPLPSGAATLAAQLADGHNVTVDNAAGGSAVNIQDGGNSITVDGTFFQATQPISAVSLPLPTGASTSALQTTIDTSINSFLYAEETLSVNGDIGAAVFGVVNPSLLFKTGDGDYGFISISGNGSLISSVAFDSNLPNTIRTAKQEDAASFNGEAGLATFSVRADVLIANAEVGTDGDYTWRRVDNFGSGWAALTGDDGARIPADSDGLKVKPIDAVIEDALTELIGINEQVDTDEYGASASVALAATHSGEVLKVCLLSTEDGSGSVLEPAGTLLILDADPATVAGDVTITAVEREAVLAQIVIAAADWQSDANGATQCPVLAESFHANSALIVLWFHEDAVSYNDVAGDDEQLELSFWYRRDS